MEEQKVEPVKAPESGVARMPPPPPPKKRDDKKKRDWKILKDVRKVITGALEVKRAEKLIRSSLEASINIYSSPMIFSNIKNIDLAELSITSNANIVESENHNGSFSLEEIKGVAIEVQRASGNKCARCWQILNEVKKKEEICIRCKDVIDKKKSSIETS